MNGWPFWPSLSCRFSLIPWVISQPLNRTPNCAFQPHRCLTFRWRFLPSLFKKSKRIPQPDLQHTWWWLQSMQPPRAAPARVPTLLVNAPWHEVQKKVSLSEDDHPQALNKRWESVLILQCSGGATFKELTAQLISCGCKVTLLFHVALDFQDGCNVFKNAKSLWKQQSYVLAQWS